MESFIFVKKEESRLISIVPNPIKVFVVNVVVVVVAFAVVVVVLQKWISIQNLCMGLSF